MLSHITMEREMMYVDEDVVENVITNDTAVSNVILERKLHLRKNVLRTERLYMPNIYIDSRSCIIIFVLQKISLILIPFPTFKQSDNSNLYFCMSVHLYIKYMSVYSTCKQIPLKQHFREKLEKKYFSLSYASQPTVFFFHFLH